MFDVTKFGAVADDMTDSTPGFQAAIDACAAAGGGIVNVPAGKYALDMTTLRSNVELHFEEGAEIRSILKAVPQDTADLAEPTSNTRRWLIGGINVENAAITGKGKIDGRGYEIFWPKEDGLEHPMYGQRYWPQFHRPKGLIHFRESKNIRIEGVTLSDPPMYTIWTLGCDQILIRDIVIRTDLKGPNVDALDIDCSSNVLITGCDFEAGDDCITVKSDSHELGYDKPSEFIHAEHCRLKCTSCGIRLGYEGDSPIRNCSFSDIVMDEVMIGISLMVAISPNDDRGIIIKYGSKITDCTFERMKINALQAFNFQYPKNPTDCPDPIKGYLDNLVFRDLDITAYRGSYIGGSTDAKIKTLFFENVNMTLTGNMGSDFAEKVPYPYPVWNDLAWSGIPWAYYIRHAECLNFKNCSVTLDNAFGGWKTEPVKTEDVAECNADISFKRK
ncbi:MAG: right-handed parallel beta-helix repeat-containing protein [Lentisphaeria bacterium]|nr:right-handed parallel beta-helix repeat-containing protein [Lentisphaeria bacterium]